MEKKSRIYIAGHTGLIGSAIVRCLKRAGYNDPSTMTHRELDLVDPEATNKFFDEVKPEYVVLAAGKVGGIVENTTYPADFMNANLAIQYNVLRAAHRVGVAKLIFFASSCMYPRECPQPMPESALLTGKPEPTSLAYAMSKLAGLQMCLAYNRQYGAQRFLPVIPNSVYGPNDNFDLHSGHVLSALVRRFHSAKREDQGSVTLWGTGSPRREFVYADDVAAACKFLLAADTDSMAFPLNMGVGADISIRELAGKVAAITGFEGQIEWDTTKPDGAPRKLLDSSLIQSYGWTPQTDLDTGLVQTYKWYVENVAAGGKNLDCH